MIHYFYGTLQVGIGQTVCVRLNMYLVLKDRLILLSTLGEEAF